MNEQDVIEILDWLGEAGVPVCLDGGWGLDALIGEQTRSHADLDLAIGRERLDDAQEVLREHGFRHEAKSKPGLPARLVLRDGEGRQVDFHPLLTDEQGDGWQQLSESGKAWGRYPVEDLNATGVIAGRQVRCISPTLQFRFRMGYEWTEREEHDIRLLIKHFGLPTPPTFKNA